MRNTGQSILEYAIMLSIVLIALSAMSLYFRRGIQSVVKIAADEAGNQTEAEEIDPLKGVKTAAEINRQVQAIQNNMLFDGRQISDSAVITNTSGSSASVSTQEK